MDELARQEVLPLRQCAVLPLSRRPAVRLWGTGLMRCRRGVQRWRWSCQLASMLAMSATVGLAQAQPGAADPATAGSRGALAETVSGMVRFTRWPQESMDMRLCVLGTGGSADELLRAGAVGTAERPLAAQSVNLPKESLGDCQVLYVSGPIDLVARDQILKSNGRPMLTIAEGRETCSDGIMFCLDPASRRFSVNLDAIARSGLRVNPQVLRLARPNSRPGS